MPLPFENTLKQLSKVAIKNAIKSEESSASKALAGTLYKDKVIKSITKGKGDFRYIVSENDEVELVTKDVINTLARRVGTEKAVTSFASMAKQDRLLKAYKALELRKVNANEDKNAVLDFYKSYKNQVDLSGNLIPKMSLAEADGKYFTIPTDYANILKKEGVIKILEDLK